MEAPAYCRVAAGGVTLRVRLVPRSARDALEGAGADAEGRCHLRARVRAVPEKGRANRALEKLLARSLDLPAGAVAVTGGASARVKTVRLAGDAGRIAARLRALETRAPGE